MEKICSKCGTKKADCVVTIGDTVTCKTEILCSGCRSLQSGDAKILSSALEMLEKAINTKTAGGGLDGYKFMLGLVGEQMAADHGYDAAVKRLKLAGDELERRRS